MVLWRLKEFYDLDLTWDEFQAEDYRSTEPGGKKGEYIEKKYEKGIMRPDGQLGFPTPTGRIEFWCDALAQFGYDPLPDFTEPLESPISQPELAEEYPLIAVTGHRVYSFFHSAWTNIPAQRKLYPDPFVHHPSRRRHEVRHHGRRMGHHHVPARTTSSPRPRCRAKRRRASCACRVRPGATTAPNWVFRATGGTRRTGTSSFRPCPPEPGYGATAMRSSLCKIEAGRGDL